MWLWLLDQGVSVLRLVTPVLFCWGQRGGEAQEILHAVTERTKYNWIAYE